MSFCGAGTNPRWFRDELATKENVEAKKLGVSAYRVLDEKASKVPPGSSGLVFIPHMAGRIAPYDPRIRGVWFGLRLDHKIEHLYRSMLEGNAYEYDYFLRVMKEYGFNPLEIRAVGGGGRSGVWNKIKADVLGIPYVRLNREDGAVLGLAAIVGFAVGVFKDLATPIRKWVRPVERIHPRKEFHQLYEGYSELYLRLITDQSGCFSQLDELTRRNLPEG